MRPNTNEKENRKSSVMNPARENTIDTSRSSASSAPCSIVHRVERHVGTDKEMNFEVQKAPKSELRVIAPSALRATRLASWLRSDCEGGEPEEEGLP
jgi:hypothetical protein